MSVSETALIETIRKAAEHQTQSRLLVGIGDDTAVLAKPARNLLFASDMLMEGVHFDLSTMDHDTWGLIGRKALAVNLSDIAAMGGRPYAVTVSLAIPEHCPEGIPLAIMEGLLSLAKEFDVTVCGGDTNVWAHPMVIDVSIIGEAPANGAILRSGAKPGDMIFVTGPLGLSIHGRHYRFTPRLKEACYLQDHYKITSMIDISDGLAKDLRHILSQSHCGAVIDSNKIPRNVDKDGVQCSLAQALCDGEDFELCFTVSSEDGMRLLSDKNYPGADLYSVYCIGMITREPEFLFTDGTVVTYAGYEHGVKR